MIYVTSDLHGDFEKYEDGLKKINLKADDSLFIVGNIVGGVGESMEILQDMMYRTNVYPIMGNQEYMAKITLTALLENIDALKNLADFKNEESGLATWLKEDGLPIMEEFLRLSEGKREQVVEFLEDFSEYDSITVKNKEYLLVHGGLGNFSLEKDIEEYTLEELVLAPTDYEKTYFEDKILVTGHTQTETLAGTNFQEKIYQGNGQIALHCGCGFGGSLGILCLDTGEEFYVD